MKCLWTLVFFNSFTHLVCSQEQLISNLQSATPDEDQTAEAKKLFRRILGSHSDRFHISVNRSMRLLNNMKEMSTIQVSSGGEAFINGSSGAAVAWGLGHYLKQSCNCQISWDHEQMNLPTELPAADLTLRAQDLVRYYENECEYGYSFVWWSWERWEKHLDWMAMSGFNLVLAHSGQELVWMRTFQRFGMTAKEAQTHFTGPAFLPWNRMGNLNRWAGPLSMAWMERDSKLQKSILKRLSGLGMVPVVPAFNGIVPKALTDLFPDVAKYQLRRWGHFDDKYSASFLWNISDPTAKSLGMTFLKLYQEEYGRNVFYSADSFNEMSPPQDDVTYLSAYSDSQISLLREFNPDAIWVMQGWMFRNVTFWNFARSRAFLSGIPLGRTLVLDLASTTSPQYGRLDGYFGQPFVTSMLHNYGGTLGLYGKAGVVNSLVYASRRNYSSMVGTGITPEGIHNSYMAYDLMIETGWRDSGVSDLNKWTDAFVLRRYGNSSLDASGKLRVQNAWRILLGSAYNCCSEVSGSRKKEFRFHGLSAVTQMPSLNLHKNLWYDENDVLRAWDEFVEGLPEKMTSGDKTALAHDAVDITRQSIANALYHFYKEVTREYSLGNIERVRHFARQSMSLLKDLDELLATCDDFLLGKWLENAKGAATNPMERIQYEYNARNLITLWGPEGNLIDYAAKQWSGLIRDYYRPRWGMFFRHLVSSLVSGKPFDQVAFESNFLEKIGKPFTLSSQVYPSSGEGDALEIVHFLHKKWRRKFQVIS